MELANETKRVVSLFEYTDKDVNKAVKEFIRQMGAPPRFSVLLSPLPLPLQLPLPMPLSLTLTLFIAVVACAVTFC